MLITQFYKDETGFIVSAELILVATILVIGLIVGLSEVQHSINSELNDVADAVGNMNQSYYYSGFAAYKSFGNGFGIKSLTTGSAFVDYGDDCDNNQCSLSCQPPVSERPKVIERSCDQNSCAATCARIN